VSVRLKIENSREGLVATISQRDDAGKVIGRPSVSLVGNKEEAKQQAKKAGAVARVETLRHRRLSRARFPGLSQP
jgi:hypothetical protein